MGADIEAFTQCLGGKECRFASQNFLHSIVVKGPTPLQGKDIVIPDLRAGFAYVLAALLAPEESNISGIHYLDRGYERLVEKLSSLGAEISRIKAEPSPLKPLVKAFAATK
jgi:UDP-N-acetylglucosamine 1-carboxyvinyltransferase